MCHQMGSHHTLHMRFWAGMWHDQAAWPLHKSVSSVGKQVGERTITATHVQLASPCRGKEQHLLKGCQPNPQAPDQKP